MKRFRIVVLLLLAYTGQALSVGAMPCQSMAHAGDAVADAAMDVADMAAVGHEMHHMNPGPDAQPTGVNGACCDTGLCAMMQCQSAPALSFDQPRSTLPLFSLYAAAAEAGAPFQRADSLYRPPISR